MIETTDVAIIGAGPSGTIAAALLRKEGRRVVVLEKTHFPRFSIGESLLPQCMEFIAEAGMLDAVNNAGFQYKNGAAFARDGLKAAFDFRDKFSVGMGTTFQVQRASFDHLLAEEAAKMGADIRFGHCIEAFAYDESDRPLLTFADSEGQRHQLSAGFVLDASGFGRVLPRLLDLELPSDFPLRMSLFTHIEDNISDSRHDRDKILIVVHPNLDDVWYWLIPFNNGRCSLGVVAPKGFFDNEVGAPEQLLREAVDASPDLVQLLVDARFDTPVSQIGGYACNVKSLWGKGYALLGNAGEFLDPVFSSGVTIAMKSASLAAPLASRSLDGENIDWESEYAQPLRLGVDTFRTYVRSWYDGSFQKVIFSQGQQTQVRAMISSILAGYAWDTDNPFVRESQRRLKTLIELCDGAAPSGETRSFGEVGPCC
ncbi:NAD(P)/FAD-dependent oxidoreductase [Haliea sp. E1-2-M8]|uniref:NAD(P)/FAD-dependent oxidoreductase n=1 Tax=Haliea sp. E1-2-M8 TaxID=3064706 RepID=UPI00272939EA|nr:NAD(P)/FAD-dependent oxidoreductase [Haliea sp. E1-2-M8]MDO8861126.1 NAD(P)/FAD-dependent oxidoreductase [Haliea sp. E1-2-M8]